MFEFIRSFFSMLTIGVKAAEDTFGTVGAVASATRAEAEGFSQALEDTRAERHATFLANLTAD